MSPVFDMPAEPTFLYLNGIADDAPRSSRWWTMTASPRFAASAIALRPVTRDG